MSNPANNMLPETLSGLICGLLFGGGLVISDMANPARVLAFLNLAGQWDASLMLVMGGALLVSLPGYWLVRKRQGPLFCTEFSVPTSRQLDKKLLTGAALFGLGWGLVGLCPGPALVALVSGQPGIFIFVISMLAGMYIFEKSPFATS